MKEAVSRRRRGEALQEAILEAAWDELNEYGFSEFTLAGVATRAGTSRTVLARRWPERRDLLVAAVRHRLQHEPLSLPDTGSLRGDVVSLLTELSVRRASLMASLLSPQFAEELLRGESLGELLRELRPSSASPMDAMLDRAVARGEIPPVKLSRRVKALPFDLLRHEVIMTSQPVPGRVIEEIVDQLFLPLVGAKTPVAGKAGQPERPVGSFVPVRGRGSQRRS